MSIPCSQATLYTVARNIWKAAKSNIADFSGAKGYYDVAYCDARILDIKAAEDLPDNQARGADSEVFGLELVGKAATCREEWQWLKGYIEDGFPKLGVKARLEEAGENYYAKSGLNDWQSVTQLMKQGRLFLANPDRSAVLTANNLMPAAFPGRFLAAETAFLAKHEASMSAGQTAKVGTGAKAEANDAIHEKLMVVCKDGKKLYRRDPIKAKQFTFKYQVGLVDGFGGAGAKIIFDGPLAANEQKYVAVADLTDEAVFDFELPASTAGPVHVALDVNDGSLIDTTPTSVVLNPGQKVSFTFSQLLKQGLSVAPTGLKMRNGNGVEVKVVVKTE